MTNEKVAEWLWNDRGWSDSGWSGSFAELPPTIRARWLQKAKALLALIEGEQGPVGEPWGYIDIDDYETVTRDHVGSIRVLGPEAARGVNDLVGLYLHPPASQEREAMELVRWIKSEVPIRDAGTWIFKLLGKVDAILNREEHREGWCPEHNRPCPWGCEMECFLDGAEWKEPNDSSANRQEPI